MHKKVLEGIVAYGYYDEETYLTVKDENEVRIRIDKYNNTIHANHIPDELKYLEGKQVKITIEEIE